MKVARAVGWSWAGALLVGVVGAAHAQDSPRFVARSDVKMNIETTPGTSLERVQRMAQHFGAPLGRLKACYAKLIERQPDAVGSLKARVIYPTKGAARVKLTSQPSNKQLALCVQRSFKGLRLAGVPRPAEALLTLDFTNTVAPHVAEVAKRQAEADAAALTQAPDGSRLARFKTGEGELAFEVRGKPDTPDAVMQGAHDMLMNALPRLLDCRRRASKELSPAGELQFNIALRGKHKPTIKGLKSTVASKWALPCSTGALRRARAPRVWGRVRAVVTFFER